MFTALWFSWKMPMGSRMLSGGLWGVELGCGSLEREIAEVWIFGTKEEQVFVVRGWCCGGDEG